MLNDVLQRLYTIDHLPSHPKLAELLQDSLSSAGEEQTGQSLADEIVRLIVYNPALTAEFLKLANAESFSFKNKISSLDEALLILDDELIELIVTQHPIVPSLKEYGSVVEGEFVKLIKHSIEARIVMENLHDRLLKDKFRDLYSTEELLTASTLHDIGLYFMLTYFPERYEELTDIIKSSHKAGKRSGPVSDLPDHCLIGAILCKHWNLPDSIVTDVAFHHYPWSSNSESLPGAELLYIADNLSSTYYDIFYDEGDIYTIDEHIVMKKRLLDMIGRFGIDVSEMSRLRTDMKRQCEDVFAELGL